MARQYKSKIVPSASAQQFSNAQRRDAQIAKRTSGMVSASGAAEPKKDTKSLTRAQVSQKKTAHGPAKTYTGPSVDELQKKLDNAVKSGKSMMASQLKKQIAAVKRMGK